METQHPTAAYEVDGLRVQLGHRTVLEGLSFRIGQGETVGLLGPNGAGKTTLLRVLGGLLPFDGHVALLGRPLRGWTDAERARAVAFVRQQLALDFGLTVEEFVLLGRTPHLGWLAHSAAADRAAVRAALDATDLAPLAARAVTAISGGEQQRAALAQALAQAARILLLDEPTAHLDVHHQYDLMARVAAQAGRTVVAAFHDLAFAARHAGRLLILDGGRLVADGPPSEVLTADLIRRVFRMEAEVRSDGATVEIRYLAPA
ncbi:MAG TPA: ABC transporter ATP-binding protein [Rubricoccaceae bacterium]|nr:ABC transporter ATP-binding protein [Rubricoccaceae bacterium]